MTIPEISGNGHFSFDNAFIQSYGLFFCYDLYYPNFCAFFTSTPPFLPRYRQPFLS